MSETLVDGHVHFHDGFSLSTFLAATVSNVARCQSTADQHANVAVLLLAQIPETDPLHGIRESVQSVTNEWTVVEPDPTSIVFRHENKPTIILIAGRQIVTSERLELLSLCSSAAMENNQPMDDSIAASVAAGGVPVVPWGFGKWTSDRGRIVRHLIERKSAATPFLLGDNGCRLRLTRPQLLTHGEELGIPVLSGSDPLPLSRHVTRPMSFGNRFSSCVDFDAPTQWAREQLIGLSSSPSTVGQCRTMLQFISDQVSLRLR